jgi:prepilin-type processing-associated H-X9-DG protein/prepilin-type N-terminal cleavage/methylation domain-containing protein
VKRAPRRSRAFSLIELLIVIGIIGLLIGLLMPVAQSVRRAARATACAANLQQWGQAYQMYLNGNNGKSFMLGDIPSRLDKGNNPLMWFELLQPYEAELKQSLLCGEASEPADNTTGDTFHAWGPDRFWDTPTKIRGPYVGSYAFNSWLYHPRTTPDGPPAAETIRLPTTQASRVPVILDAARLDMPVLDTDPPCLFGSPGASGNMRFAALERHKDGVNVLFLDGHAEQVPAPGLWNLKWSDKFQPRQVTIQR